MKQFFSFILCLFVYVSIGLLSADEISLKSIFNGKDLTGWEVPKDNIWFTAKDGILKLENGPKKRGQTLWTSQEYEDFEMEFDFVVSGVAVERIAIPAGLGARRPSSGRPSCVR